MSKDIKQILGKPTISAAIGAVSIPMLSGGTEYIYNGQRYPLWALGAGLGFASSFVSELAHTYVLPAIPQSEKYMRLESMVLGLASSSGAFVLGAKLINSDLNMSEARTFAIAGAASEVLSSYIASNFLGEGTM